MDLTNPLTVAVVGGGLAGLTAARSLLDRGCNVRVFDKGRGPAGRMSSRREPLVFDHGAQYFTARDPLFQRVVEEWVRVGVAGVWDVRLGVADGGRLREKAPGVTRYVGVPRMSAVPRRLASGLDIRARTRVESLARTGDRWRLSAEGGADLGVFDAVLVTLPPAQAADLLSGAAPDLAARVRAVEMRPCWAVLAGFPEPIPTPLDGVFVHDAPLSWIARDSSKPGRPSSECWVLHGSPAWSAEHLERSPEEVQEKLLAAFFAVVGVGRVAPAFVTAHRWRYALAANPLDIGCFFDAERRLGVGGDWCHGSRVEGAFLSGRALSHRLATALSLPIGPESTGTQTAAT